MPEKRKVAVYDIAGRKTRTIGVIVPKLDSHFITAALKGIQEVTTESGYDIVITHSQECVEKEAANVRLLRQREVDGVLAALSCATRNTLHFSELTSNGIPVVYFDRVGGACNSDAVVIDNERCGFLATEHLIREGCTRVAIVTSNPRRSVYAQRYEGFRKALRAYQLEFTQELVIEGGTDREAGAEAARQVLAMRQRPDGLFVTNDLMAAMCMHTLTEAGVRIPEDIAIVGFNNDPIGRLITPSLTTIDYPGFEMGRTAATHLLDHMTGKKTGRAHSMAIVPSSLIIRGSSARRHAV